MFVFKSKVNISTESVKDLYVSYWKAQGLTDLLRLAHAL